jgi:hypothetical protein
VRAGQQPAPPCKTAFDVDGPQPGDYDTLSVAGDADLLGGTIEIDFLKGLAANNETFDFITADKLEMSDIDRDVTGLGSGFDYLESVENGALVFTVGGSVPEPPTWSLFGVGLLGLTLFRLGKRFSPLRRRPPYKTRAHRMTPRKNTPDRDSHVAAGHARLSGLVSRAPVWLNQKGQWRKSYQPILASSAVR